ncbi:MAG: helix-turn-helix domain-containing protein [Bacilli bacterium]|nr:helix-turn-helix domain-containing protein [Bacilli bacterium]
MFNEKVGRAISFLRKRAGLTQMDLAIRLGVTDKAVSKWERGLGVPDISIISRLSVILDTDTDSLLAGDVINHSNKWVGLLILNGNVPVSEKIIDKPLIYFMMSYFLLVGIRIINVCCNDKDKEYIESNSALWDTLGICISFNKLVEFENNNNHNAMIVIGNIFVYGVDLTKFLKKGMAYDDRPIVLSLPKRIDSGKVVHFNDNMRIIDVENDEVLNTQYDYYELPIFFVPQRYLKSVLQSVGFISGNSNVTFFTSCLDRGFVELYANNYEELEELKSFVNIVQKACGMQIYCIEEIAWRRGFIDMNTLKKLGVNQNDSIYGRYILRLVSDNKEK